MTRIQSRWMRWRKISGGGCDEACDDLWVADSGNDG